MVSLGTGRVPVVQRDHIDMYVPSGILEGVRVVKGLSAFIGLLIDQVCRTINNQCSILLEKSCLGVFGDFFSLTP